jgi:broad specificity phosphatase PhoE
MNVVVLIRHVETDLVGTFCGHSDPNVNPAGALRIRSLCEEVATLGITHIYSSDLRRASQTAMAIGNRIGAPVELRPGLREIYFGLWEGLRWEQIEREYPHEAAEWVSEFPKHKAPAGEAYRDFTTRVEAEFRRAITADTSGARALVTHRGVMQYLLTNFFGFSAHEAGKQTEDYGSIVVAGPSNLCEVDYADGRA